MYEGDEKRMKEKVGKSQQGEDGDIKTTNLK